jgi:hypothetical protein
MAKSEQTNPVASKLRDQWHAILAVTIHKLKVAEIVITEADVRSFQKSPNQAVLCYDRPDGIHLMLITEAQALALAEQDELLRNITEQNKEQ